MYDPIALLTPPYEEYSFKVGESLGIRYISSFLRENGVEANVYEPVLYGWNMEKTVSHVLRKDYDVVGISTAAGLFKNAFELVKELRNAGYNGKIILGGHFATFEYPKILRKIPEVDGVIVGEGEIPTLKFIQGDKRYLATRNNLVPLRKFVEDLDSLPFPYRDDLKGREHYSVVSGKGCYGRCAFCSVPAFYGEKIRLRSPKNVVDEIEMLVTDYGARAISFVDDNFIMGKYGKKRALEIAEELMERGLDIKFIIAARANDISRDVMAKLKKVGLVAVEIGFEAASITQLRRYNKGITPQISRKAIKTLRELGIRIIPFFINFDPDVTIKEIRANIKFMRKNNFVTYKNLSNKLYPYPGTLIYSKLKEEGRLLEDEWEYDYEFKNSEVDTIYRKILMAEYLKIVDFIKEVLLYWTDLGRGDYSYELFVIQEKMNEFADKIIDMPEDTIAEFSKDITWEILSLDGSKKVVREILNEDI